SVIPARGCRARNPGFRFRLMTAQVNVGRERRAIMESRTSRASLVIGTISHQPGQIDAIIEKLATLIRSYKTERIIRIAVDGVDGVGKTIFADKLGSAIAGMGRPIIRSSVDGFHNPRELRYRRGKTFSGGLLPGLLRLCGFADALARSTCSRRLWSISLSGVRSRDGLSSACPRAYCSGRIRSDPRWPVPSSPGTARSLGSLDIP